MSREKVKECLKEALEFVIIAVPITVCFFLVKKGIETDVEIIVKAFME